MIILSTYRQSDRATLDYAVQTKMRVGIGDIFVANFTGKLDVFVKAHQ